MNMPLFIARHEYQFRK